MIGWFSAFRENGSPSDFQVGPAPFPINQQLIGLLSIFIIPSIAFLIVLPGIRHQKLTSAITFLFTMFTGASLLVSIFQPCWQKAEARILVNYKSFNNQRMDAYLQINIGLSKVNITLQTQGPLLNYNEQFELRNRNPIEFERALQRGSLYPFLTILEFLTIDLNGFDYGKKLHFAGYYTAALLWFSFTLWIFQFLFLYILPNKFGVLSLCVGINTLLANLCYFSSTPNQLVIRFPSPQGQTAFLKFHFSYCFYATFICGLASTFVGLALIFARHFFKYTLETSISDYSTYREETQCKLRKKQGSVVGSLHNLDIFVINNKKVNEDSWIVEMGIVEELSKSTTVNPFGMPRQAYCATSNAPVEFGSGKYYALCGFGGILSCGITHTLIVPLDLIKCRIQVNPEKYKGIIGGVRTTLTEEGVRALGKGWAPTAIGYSLQGLGKFGFYEMFKIVYGDLLGEELAYHWRTSLYLAASASAEFFADILLAPMEATKVRIQTSPGAPPTLRGCVPFIYKSEGLTGFYKGLPPLWMRQIPYTMMKFACFERTVELLYKHVVPKPREQCSKPEQLVVTFVAGYIAGVFCAVVSHPADTVVSKLNQDSGASAVDILKKLGPIGVWGGLVPRIIMIGTLTALQWFIYDSVKVVFNLPRPPPPTLPSLKKPEVMSTTAT